MRKFVVLFAKTTKQSLRKSVSDLPNSDPLFHSDEEALKLIEQEPPNSRRKNFSKWQETNMGSILL